jgi:hypothetical protein
MKYVKATRDRHVMPTYYKGMVLAELEPVVNDYRQRSLALEAPVEYAGKSWTVTATFGDGTVDLVRWSRYPHADAVTGKVEWRPCRNRARAVPGTECNRPDRVYVPHPHVSPIAGYRVVKI